MSILTLITFVLLSPFMAISLLPAIRDVDKENEEEESIVRWRN